MFHWNGTQWMEEAKLKASDVAQHDEFGQVSISGDHIVVGAYGDDDLGENSGSVYVFHWDGTQWVEEAKLLASDGAAYDSFRWVSISGDRIVVGASGDDDLGTDSGSAYVFHWDGTQWVEEAKLLASDGAEGDGFGLVSISGDRIAVGSDGNDDLGENSGSAYMFRLSSGAVEISAPDTTATHLEALSVPIRVSNTTDKDIVSAEVFVAYDGDLLTAISSGASGTLLTEDWSVETNIVEGIATPIDTIKMAMATDDDVLSGEGVLINVNFQVADIRHPASSPLTLTHVLFNDGTPDYVSTDGSVTLVGVDGSITSLPEQIIPRWSIDVTVDDTDEDRYTGSADAFDVSVTNGHQTEILTLTETDVSTGIFVGTITTVFSLASTSASSSADNTVQAKAGDEIIFAYADSLDTSGNTVQRSDFTDVIGGTDGTLRITVVTQPGDTVRVRVTDADLNTNPGTQETTTVTGVNTSTNESETITLTEYDADDDVFFGIVETTYGTVAGTDDDGAFNAQKGDELVVTYADTLLANGGIANLPDIDYVVDPFGDADANGSVQAFDAAKVLYHVLAPFLTGLDSLSANVDLLAPFGEITPYDASLILQKRVGLIDRFEVQEDEADNHPQPETDNSVPKYVPEERRLTLVPGEGYMGIWVDERDGILSGDLLLKKIHGRVTMAEELSGFLSASKETDNGLRIVFAGMEDAKGPGELLRVYGVGPESAQLARALFNDGRLGVRLVDSEMDSPPRPPQFALYANAPNPFNPETAIHFALPQASEVRLEVFDVVGQQVRTLRAGGLPAGLHRAVWDGRGETGKPVGSGVYFYRLQARHEGRMFTQVRRMMLLK